MGNMVIVVFMHRERKPSVYWLFQNFSRQNNTMKKTP